MKKYFLVFFLLLFLTGCASKTIYQVDGIPLPDNVIKAKTFNLGLTIKYNLTKIYKVEEDDESYETFEYLPLINSNILKIKNPEKLILNISVFNPLKEEYKIIKFITMEGGEEEKEVIYNGNISRNNLVVELPLISNKLVSFYYDACDKRDNLVFKSFRAQYIIEELKNKFDDSSNHHY